MKLLVKIGVFSVVGIAMSYAQPAPTGDPGVGAGGSVTANSRVGTRLSFPDMLAQAQVSREAILSDYRHVKHLQETARKDKDVIKLNCVNDKLVQIKPQMNIGDTAVMTLQNSAESDDRPTLFTDVTLAAENVHRLREEADQCIGEPTLATESKSGYTAPDVPDSPYGDPFTPVVEPPGYASPWN
jgi:hypothetical protein